MSRAALLALAERAERAEGADRFIDYDVAVALGLVPDNAVQMAGFEPDPGCYTTHGGDATPVPAFTASLDAAASLVPARWTRMILSTPGYIAGFLVGDVLCGLHKDISGGGGPMVYGIASGKHAEARARTAAALRAWAQEAAKEARDTADTHEVLEQPMDWTKGGRVYNWRNYVGPRLRALWGRLPDAVKVAVAEDAQEIADNEEWPR